MIKLDLYYHLNNAELGSYFVEKYVFFLGLYSCSKGSNNSY